MEVPQTLELVGYMGDLREGGRGGGRGEGEGKIRWKEWTRREEGGNQEQLSENAFKGSNGLPVLSVYTYSEHLRGLIFCLRAFLLLFFLFLLFLLSLLLLGLRTNRKVATVTTES